MGNVLTDNQKESFQVGLALVNITPMRRRTMSLDDLKQEGSDLVSKIVTTHEPLSNFIKVHGSPSESQKTLHGDTIHVWDETTFNHKKGRYVLFVMEFDGLTASMLHTYEAYRFDKANRKVRQAWAGQN